KLSKATVETLSIIVYHQPVTRAEIEEIRGVSFASNTLEILLELNWVKPAGRKDVPGKPIQYATTEKVGKIKNFSFKIKSHIEIGSIDNKIDFDTSIKLSGSRFVVLKDQFALLERALINFMLDTHVNEFKYTEISPPLIVNEDVMFGTGQLPKFEDDQFEIKFDNSEQRKFLIPTAEVVLTNLVRKSIIEKNQLPQRFVASTPCFRKEAGSYGKDTKGMIRQHQFYKVELVSIVEQGNCTNELDRMLNCAEKILEKLDIPYQVVLLSSGDMGFSAEKTYDIEAWVPSENKYREISSCSSCGSFQARRMGAKYKSINGTEFVGTLNGSGLAVGRLMIALLENNQNEDGSVNIPKVLKKYMNNLDKI
ncbi:serine--tRNA ligase, partial [Pelagibacteraceae bacterium]|nr:serine--tRNA ligase [Pelagibacteraceae bacterium]